MACTRCRIFESFSWIAYGDACAKIVYGFQLREAVMCQSWLGTATENRKQKPVNYYNACPPFTANTCPFTKEASLEARNK